MPEYPNPKLRPIPDAPQPTAPAEAPYAELDVTTNFSFLRGASHPDELVFQAANLGYRALAITDLNTLAGVVRAHVAAKQTGLKLIVGCRLRFTDAPDVLVWPTDRLAYARLCRLLTTGKRRAEKAQCHLTLNDLLENNTGLLAAVVATPKSDPRPLNLLREALGDSLSLAASCLYGADDSTHIRRMQSLARKSSIPLLATNHVHYHDPSRRPLQDLLTCVRYGCTIQEGGYRLFPNGERYLKPPDQMHRLFIDHPAAIQHGLDIAAQCTFSLNELQYEYPVELAPPGLTSLQYLHHLTWAGAADRYPNGIPDKVRRQIEHELKLIEQLKFEAYFLTVYDIVKFARSRDILCQGRGSAANSVVCYCLAITSVSPELIDVLFERFMSAARNEPPDIDVDFEHERREEVIQYVYNKYGRERAGMTAEVITYRGRSAVRDVGKALGLSLDTVDQMARRLDWWHRGTLTESQLQEVGLDPHDRTVKQVISLTTELLGFPRHLSQHVGGMVMTRGPLCEMVPIENAAMPDRTVIEWDKDDIDKLGILKVDALALGMLTCISKALKLVNRLNSDEATKRQSDEGEDFHGEHNGNRENISGPDCVAERERVGKSCLSGNTSYAGRGAFRPDQSDAPGSHFHSIQHRRGTRPAEPCGLSEIPQNIAGVAGGTNDTNRNCEGIKNDAPQPDPLRSAGGNGSGSPRPDPRLGEKDGCVNSLPLRRFVASSLRRSPLELHTVPPEDPSVYDMICKADTIGVFQIESRAQMSMLPRLKPRKFYDLVIEVAIVRPGPIQGDMVHPYLRRRNGEEPVSYPSEALREVLEKTLGVPLFQEQAMRIVMVAAGFSAEEADRLRRAMAAWKRSAGIDQFHEKIVSGMLAKGYTPEFAEQCFNQIRGFGEYGFPESHAASFAILVYVSCWLKHYHPAPFAAALINSQPMGFYAPAQIVRDAREHGVEARPADVNHSQWDCTLEEKTDTKNPHPPLRLGLRIIKHFKSLHAQRITEARRAGPFTSIPHFHRATALPVSALRLLAEADTFTSLNLTRRQALWEVLSLSDESAPLFDLLPNSALSTQHSALPDNSALPTMPEGQEIMTDYSTVGLSLKNHPLALLRNYFTQKKIIPATQLRKMKHGDWVSVAGLVLVRQRPGTASGIVFETLEDETGIANLILRPDIYDRYRPAARHAALLQAEGILECQGEVIHIMAKRLTDLSSLLTGYQFHSRDFH